MDGLQDEARLEEQGTTQQTQGASAQVSGGDLAQRAKARGAKAKRRFLCASF